MNEEFELSIVFDNKQYRFKAKVLGPGYTHKFQIDVDGTGVLFKPDKEMNYKSLDRSC
jgi:hypothetical protein